MADTYITKQGVVALQHADGTNPLYRYGDPVDLSLLSEAQLLHLDPLTGDDPGVKYEKSLSQERANSQSIDESSDFRAAMADAGQPGSTSSPIPSNYGELDEAERARFIEIIPDAKTQAVVVAHELRNGGAKSVVDAAPKAVVELAKRYVETEGVTDAVGPNVHFDSGEAEAVPTVAEPTEVPPVTGGQGDASTGTVPGTPEEAEARANGENANGGEDNEPLTGKELDARGKELGIEGFSSMKADEKREAVAKAEAAASQD